MFLHEHAWGWPWRDKKTGRDRQTCTRCGAQRESSIQFPTRPAPQNASISEEGAA
jgi:hypothetical protein